MMKLHLSLMPLKETERKLDCATTHSCSIYNSICFLSNSSFYIRYIVKFLS